MTPKTTLAGFGATVMLMAGVDASVLDETPLERVETVANERVEAKQIGNTVETTLPWKGEQGIKVKVDLGEPTISERLADKRKKEVITETVDFGDGGFKVDILLNEKPDTNIFCYQIEGAENYDFFYQPPLTEQEIAEGAERPEDIAGSYAVYHKTLKDHQLGKENYATGKVMHIPRPQVWEFNNEDVTKEWADLTYDERGLCVTARQEFLDKATYPVRVDPTFGYTSQGATSQTIENSIVMGRYTAPVASKGSGVHAWISLSAVPTLGKIKANIYANGSGDTDTSPTPITNGESYDEIFGVGTANPYVRSFPFITQPDFASGTAYRLAIWSQSVSGNALTYYDTSISGEYGYTDSESFGSWPNPASTTIQVDWRVSIYTSYCVEESPCGITFASPSATPSYTWTVPDTVTSAVVACWGGGGGADVISSSAGGGGGGGAFASSTVAVSAGQDWTVVVGAGGDGQTTPTAGGNSLFRFGVATATLAAGGAFANGTAGGVGGSTANSSGTVEYAGGTGGNGNTTGDVGGGGGGAAGPNAAGGNGAAGASSIGGGGGGANNGASGNGSGVTGGTGANGGGNGGNGGNAAAGSVGVAGENGGGGGGGGDDTFSGGHGGFPGGGGGGAEVFSGTSGDGAPGQCTITYTITASGDPSPADNFWDDM